MTRHPNMGALNAFCCLLVHFFRPELLPTPILNIPINFLHPSTVNTASDRYLASWRD